MYGDSKRNDTYSFLKIFISSFENSVDLDQMASVEPTRNQLARFHTVFIHASNSYLKITNI